MTEPRTTASLRSRTHEIIFGHETPAGKLFDVVLIWLILISVLVVMLESVTAYRLNYGEWLRRAEWGFTIAFTIEYALRLWCAPSMGRYARSFFGIVDLLAIVPTYLTLIVPGGQALLTVRALRLLRVFRVLKLAHYVSEASVLTRALRASRHKITVFVSAVLVLVVTFGSMMYLVHSDVDDRGLRRHRAGDADRPGARRDDHDPGLRDHRGADGYRDGGNRRRREGGPRQPRLRALQTRRA